MDLGKNQFSPIQPPTSFPVEYLLLTLVACFGLMSAHQVTAQSFTVLHSFTADSGDPGYTNSDGATPEGGLILSGSTLYGTTYECGAANSGVLFRINTNGAAFTNLHNFTSFRDTFDTNSDGALENAGLILSGNTLYGTANLGGSAGNGTVFKVNTDGTGFTTLHHFTVLDPAASTNGDGAYPTAGLILSGGALYGTAGFGGAYGNGTVFKINTNGTGFTTLHSFTADSGGPDYTNSDGSVPYAGLILSGTNLYGTAQYGGSSGEGTVFRVSTNGTGFTTLHSFTAVSSDPDDFNSDGARPVAELILSGSTLYGTALLGGPSGEGTVFKLNTDGTAFTVLHSFTATSGSLNTNSDGVQPYAGLILSGATLYGTAQYGGNAGVGAVFALNANGTGFRTLYNFTGGSDGSFPQGTLLLSGNILYGTAVQGGSSDRGTVFSFSLPLPPQLTIIRSGTNVVLTWPTNATGFTLQSTTNLVSSLAWSNVSPGPFIVNGQNAVTNPVFGAKKFFRLSQ